MTKRPDQHSADGTRRLKVAEVVARRIVSDISEQQLPPNQLLETEAAMQARYEVSRGSLREALRLLESQGIITLRAGQGGGPVVAPRDAHFLGRLLALHCEIHDVTYAELAKAQELLEPLMAEEAARHRSNPELPAHLSESEHSPEGDFHEWVYAVADNGALTLVVSAISSIMAHHLRLTVDISELARQTHHEHRAIREAIYAGDPDAARETMLRHVRRNMQFGRRARQDFLQATVRWL